MPELPDIELYLTRIRERILGENLQKLRIFSPFVLRSFSVKPAQFEGKKCTDVQRLGKRIVLNFEDELWAVIHLMIAGRFQWQSPLPVEKAAMGKMMLFAFRFDSGQLSLVEASSKKRASLYLVDSADQLRDHRREGLDIFSTDLAQFKAALVAKNRTLKRALTDPHTLDGIGNAYSDEILHEARLSPIRLTQSLTESELDGLLASARRVLAEWRDRLTTRYPNFPRPGDVTAFRPEFAAHGKFGKPCPVCQSPIQRIVYAENETNYCARCQNGGRILADRSLSRLLKDQWPRTLEDTAD